MVVMVTRMYNKYLDMGTSSITTTITTSITTTTTTTIITTTINSTISSSDGGAGAGINNIYRRTQSIITTRRNVVALTIPNTISLSHLRYVYYSGGSTVRTPPPTSQRVRTLSLVGILHT